MSSSSSNGYLIQNASAAGQLPLHLSGQGDSSLNNGSTTANGQPWAVGIVFNPSSIPTGSPDTNYRSLWSQTNVAAGDQNGYRISLDLIRNGKIRFYFGKNYHSSNNNNWYKWTSHENFVSSNKWLNGYKVGNNWRQPNLEGSGNELSGFALGNDNNGAKGTKVWLMGDGTNDSDGNIRNQVSNGSSTQELTSRGSPAPAIQNISFP